MASGVSARMYGSWLRAEEKGSISFVNPATDAVEQQRLIELVKEPSMNKVMLPNNCHFGESSRQERADGAENARRDTGLNKDDTEAIFQNALAMSPELEALLITSKRQSLILEKDLKAAVMTQLRKYQLGTDELSE